MSLTADQLREYLDYDPVTGEFRWAKDIGCKVKQGSKAGSVDCIGYVKIKINRKQYSAHRLAFLYMEGRWPDSFMDHINGNRSDNRWENLREANIVQNSHNRKVRSNSKLGIKGVNFRLNKNRYQATIVVEGRKIRLGYYATPEEAHAAYCQAAQEYHGDFANFG